MAGSLREVTGKAGTWQLRVPRRACAVIARGWRGRPAVALPVRLGGSDIAGVGAALGGHATAAAKAV